MPKRRSRERGGRPTATEGRVGAVMDGLNSMQDVVRDDPSTMEDAALDDQRAAFDRITGKGRGRRGRDRDDDDRYDERDEGDDRRDEDDDEDLDEDDRYEQDEDERFEDETDDLEEADQERGHRRGEGRSLERALNALRRIDAPDWVFRQKPARIRELAESMAGWQGNHDRTLQQRDDRIRDLESAPRREAADESPETERAVPSVVDLNAAATRIVEALGVEADADARKALAEGLKAAGASGHARALAAEESMRRQGALMDTMLVMLARREMGDAYPQLVSDPTAMKKFERRVGEQARTGVYKNDLDGLFKDAALLEFGVPQKVGRNGRKRRRSRPVTDGKPLRRHTNAAEPGSERHSRQVYDKIRRRSRRRLSAGR